VYIAVFREKVIGGEFTFARVFDTLEEALAGATRIIEDDIGGHKLHVRLFRPGEEVPLRREQVEEPRPARVSERVVICDAEEG
jgi:hypothetical protein